MKKFEHIDDNPGSYFGMLVESLEDNKLEEADTLAKPFRKEVKNAYKAQDRRIDDTKKYNTDQEKEIQAIAKKSNFSDEDTELFRKLFIKDVPKHSSKRTFKTYQGLEKNKYPFYVTYYEEIPYYHPEEGGYYIAGMQAVASKGFDTRQDAVDYADEVYGYMEKVHNNHYIERSKYIGDSDHVYIETEKDYLSREKGDTRYESLKEDKFVPQAKMSKKSQKELNDKKRGTWGNTNPVTRVQPNKKAYDRKRDKKVVDERLDKQSDFELSYALDELEELSNYYRSKQDDWSKKDSQEFLVDVNNLLHRVQHLFRKAEIIDESKKLNEKITEDSEVFKDMSNALDDIEYLCNDTYNWGMDEWNDKNNVKNTAERIIDSANVLLDSIKKY